MKSILEYLTNRLQEPSTWRGLIGLASAIGVVLTPEQADGIIAAGISLIAVINIFKKDAKSPDAKPI